MPIAHGEGKFTASDDILKSLKQQKQIAGVYYKGTICSYQDLPANPNGSMLDIAMITSADGKILGTMPHPERGMFFTQTPSWPLEKEKLMRAGKLLPKYGPGLQIFKNAINYFN
jgi:phosphoribosylformylglycinamidine synthase